MSLIALGDRIMFVVVVVIVDSVMSVYHIAHRERKTDCCVYQQELLVDNYVFMASAKFIMCI